VLEMHTGDTVGHISPVIAGDYDEGYEYTDIKVETRLLKSGNYM
jgi:hypothetical protein